MCVVQGPVGDGERAADARRQCGPCRRRIEDDRIFQDDEQLCDLAMTKAVNYVNILPYIKKILKKDGKLVVFRSQKIENSDTLQGMILCDEISYDLPFGFGKRVLSIMEYYSMEG